MKAWLNHLHKYCFKPFVLRLFFWGESWLCMSWMVPWHIFFFMSGINHNSESQPNPPLLLYLSSFSSFSTAICPIYLRTLTPKYLTFFTIHFFILYFLNHVYECCYTIVNIFLLLLLFFLLNNSNID